VGKLEGFLMLNDVEPICAILHFVEDYYALKHTNNKNVINR